MYNLVLKIKSCSYGGYSIVLIGKQLPGCGKEKTSSEGAKCNLVIPLRHEQTLPQMFGNLTLHVICGWRGERRFAFILKTPNIAPVFQV